MVAYLSSRWRVLRLFSPPKLAYHLIEKVKGLLIRADKAGKVETSINVMRKGHELVTQGVNKAMLAGNTMHKTNESSENGFSEGASCDCR